MSLTIRARHALSPQFTLDLDCRLEAAITVLFGGSGSGKTATLDLVAGFLRPAQGQVELDKAVLTDTAQGIHVPPQRRAIGYVLQDRALFPHLSLRDNVAFGAGDRSRASSLLERFGLADLASRLPSQVSGGQRQRCAIARALALQPRLLLLDEPAQGLDAPLREDLLGLLREMRAMESVPVVLVTHHVQEALAVADEMVVLEQGCVVQQAPPAVIMDQPASPAVARLTGLYAEVPVTVERWEDGWAEVGWQGERLRLPSRPVPTGPALLCYRPDAAKASSQGVPVTICERRLSPAGWELVGEGGWRVLSREPHSGNGMRLQVERGLLFPQ